MQSLRRRLSFRKKKDSVPECSKPYQWQEDEKKVRDGTCSFQVKYLGYIEVFDSRGMHVCEEAVKALKSQCKGKYQRAVLYVSGDALRVVDEVSKSMIVDQTIEKVSFCAPDRNHEKGFAYICRDGTTRRWMCHGFLAVKESGERLSHAVGCAFAICLEKKQKRDKETGVTVTFNQSRTSFERTGSFRQTTLTERIADPQSAILAEPVPVRSVSNPYAVQRPTASVDLLERQGSFRGFEKLQEVSSPFKRTTSLRLNDLPSTLQRQNSIMESPTQNGNGAVGGATAAAIDEVSQEQEDSIAQMCQQLTQGLSAMSADSSAPQGATGGGRPGPLTHQASLPTPTSAYTRPRPVAGQPMLARQHTSPASQTLVPSQQPTVSNPWAHNNSSWPGGGAAASASSSPASLSTPASSSTAVSTNSNNPFAAPAPSSAPRHFNGASQGRSHSMDQGDMSAVHWQQQQQVSQRSINGSVGSNPWPTSARPVPTSQAAGADPFDVAWASKSVNKGPGPGAGSGGGSNNNSSPSSSNNPFGNKGVKKFEVQL